MRNNSKALIRNNIDSKSLALEDCLFQLIIERFENAIEIGRIKQQLKEKLRNVRREYAVLKHVTSIPCRRLSKHNRRAIYRTVMRASRKLEAETTTLEISPKYTKAQLQEAKREHRNKIDELDSQIIHVVDEWVTVGATNDSSKIKAADLEKLRLRVCKLKTTSNIKQWIWQIILTALNCPTTLVATPLQRATNN